MAIERQTMIDTVIHSDCLSVLRDMADNSVDAIVSDPPAGISFMGKAWDNFTGKQKSYDSAGERAKANADKEKLKLYKQGSTPFAYSSSSGQTTAKERDAFIAFLTQVMTEALRVIKPGGHALIWALPRTSHWTATALEDAGFEVRDKLYHLFGSGFPKSLDISKAIDRMQGAEREVIYRGDEPGREGRKTRKRMPQPMDWGNEAYAPDNYTITKPATPEAAQYAGYGTALKPSCEEWILVRKPLAESSIAAQVLATGTGGLNIDACRVGVSQDDPNWRDNATARNGAKSTAVYGEFGEIKAQNLSQQGRFPSHLLLSHSLWCVPRGTKRVLSNRWGKGNERHGKDGESIFNLGKNIDTTGYEDADGYEHVEAYDCAPDCPIAELDRQSGVTTHKRNGQRKGGIWTSNGNGGNISAPGDTGGSSRYFTNFPPDDYTPFLYQSKASRAERNAGCEDLPSVQGFDKNTSKHIAHINHSTGETTYNEYKPSANGNGHPTVKPLALMRWFIRLITPPDGIVLDPFCGSGSTCVAAIQEGKHFIGIEQDSSYCDIANARIEYARTHEPDVVQVATKKVRRGSGDKTKGTEPTIKNVYTQGFTDRSLVQYGDQDGMEEVEDWECAPDCPVRILGEQSGERKSGDLQPWHKANGIPSNSLSGGKDGSLNSRHGASYGDTGTAARYFQQFPPDSLWCDEIDYSPIEEVP